MKVLINGGAGLVVAYTGFIALADAITSLFEPKAPTIGTGAGPIDELSLG